PPVAALAHLAEDVSRQRLCLVSAALEVAHEPEQPLGPAEPSPVAGLDEGARRLAEALLGLGEATEGVGDLGQVPESPRLLAPRWAPVARPWHRPAPTALRVGLRPRPPG